MCEVTMNTPTVTRREREEFLVFDGKALYGAHVECRRRRRHSTNLIIETPARINKYGPQHLLSTNPPEQATVPAIPHYPRHATVISLAHDGST